MPKAQHLTVTGYLRNTNAPSANVFAELPSSTMQQPQELHARAALALCFLHAASRLACGRPRKACTKLFCELCWEKVYGQKEAEQVLSPFLIPVVPKVFWLMSLSHFSRRWLPAGLAPTCMASRELVPAVVKCSMWNGPTKQAPCKSICIKSVF